VDSLHITPGFVRVGPLGDLEGQVVEKQVGMDEGSNRGQLWLGRSMSESFDLFIKEGNPKNTLLDKSSPGGVCSIVSSQPILERIEDCTKSLPKTGDLKNRKSSRRIQSLPTLGVPKCLRFVGVVQASSKRGKT
jgi:hypothetical protein